MSLTSPAKVAEPTFLGFLWSGTAVSFCFLVFRIFVELRTFHKLHSDAYLVVLAWAMLFGSAIFWQVEKSPLYELYALGSGQKPFTPGYFDRVTGFIRTVVPFQILFICCLWTIKLSLLLFFRRLWSNVKGHKTWWWFVLIVNVLGWAASIGLIDFECSLGPTEKIIAYCSTRVANKRGNSAFIASCVADLVTDGLVISVPVWMLWNAKIPLRQKALLMAIFSLSAIVMIVAVIRVALVTSTEHPKDLTWLFFWSNVEMTTSIIIACVASFRQLFVTANRPNHNVRPSGSWEGSTFSSKSIWKFPRKTPNRREFLRDGRNEGDNTVRSPPEHWNSLTHIVPPNSIHVDYNIWVRTSDVQDNDHTPIAPYTSIRSNAGV